MEIKDALKAVAPAVGDGKLVWQHAYVLFDGESLRAFDGQMWASAAIDSLNTPLFLRHDALTSSMSREGAELVINDNNITVRAGRSRVKMKRSDATTFPTEPVYSHLWVEAPPADFKDTLAALSKFCGAQDNHIWQMGVHFVDGVVFAANPFALTVKSQNWTPGSLTIPPWAVRFILAQDEPPNLISDSGQHIRLLWSHRMGLVSSKLIQEPSEDAVMMAHNIMDDVIRGDPVPDNLKEAVERAKALGATRLLIGDNKASHVTDDLEFEVDIAMPCVPKIWGVEPLLAALEHAEVINLHSHPAKWEGGGYKGVFAGMSN